MLKTDEDKSYVSCRPATTQKFKRVSGRIVLINIDAREAEYSAHGKSWGHLGLLHIGTIAEQEGFEVVLWDELILGKVNLGDLVRAGDIVGLSVVVTGVVDAQEYSHRAKELGASYVFCGNDQASSRAKQMLKNNSIDGVFVGDDLASIRKILRNLKREGILPDIDIAGFDRRGQPVVISRERSPDAEYFIIPNLSLYSKKHWEKVWDNHRKLNGFEYLNPDDLKNSTILFAGGCSRGSNILGFRVNIEDKN